jgi:hypothetical protein
VTSSGSASGTGSSSGSTTSNYWERRRRAAARQLLEVRPARGRALAPNTIAAASRSGGARRHGSCWRCGPPAGGRWRPTQLLRRRAAAAQRARTSRAAAPLQC